MKNNLIFLLAIFTFLNAATASACSVGPGYLHIHHTELVKQTNSIILAKAIDAENVLGAKFETIEVIKGEDIADFIVPNGWVINQDDEFKNYYLRGQIEEDFDGHRNLMFWDEGITREWHGAACTMHPKFVSGNNYLIFLNNPHYKAYEEIKYPDDLWLMAVRKLVQDTTLKSGLSLTLNQWLELTNFAFIGEIDDCRGVHVQTLAILNGQPPVDWFLDKDHNNIDPECKVGIKFFMAGYLPYIEGNSRDKRTFGELVKDNNVDFNRILMDSEIDILGSKIMNLEK